MEKGSKREFSLQLQNIIQLLKILRREVPRDLSLSMESLAQLMIDHNVGVSTTKTYEIKRVDSDYFAENTENT